MRIWLVVEEERCTTGIPKNKFVRIHDAAISNDRAMELAGALLDPTGANAIALHEININENPDRLQVGDIVSHYKRKEFLRKKYNGITRPEKYDPVYTYRIKSFAIHSETKEKLVIYEALYTEKSLGVKKHQVFARPYDMFMSEIDDPLSDQDYRFQLIIPGNNQEEEDD